MNIFSNYEIFLLFCSLSINTQFMHIYVNICTKYPSKVILCCGEMIMWIALKSIPYYGKKKLQY